MTQVKIIKGKKRTVYTGKKGGKYYISKGKKVYFGISIGTISDFDWDQYQETSAAAATFDLAKWSYKTKFGKKKTKQTRK